MPLLTGSSTMPAAIPDITLSYASVCALRILSTSSGAAVTQLPRLFTNRQWDWLAD